MPLLHIAQQKECIFRENEGNKIQYITFTYLRADIQITILYDSIHCIPPVSYSMGRDMNTRVASNKCKISELKQYIYRGPLIIGFVTRLSEPQPDEARIMESPET